MSILKESREAQAHYWEERQTRLIEAGEKSAAELVADLKTTYDATFKKLQKEIEAFHGRYATETGLSIADIQKRLSPAELKSAKEDIKRYFDEVKRLGLDPEYKVYLRELSARAYMSRLEELKANIRHEIEKLYMQQQNGFNEGMSQVYEDSYYQSTFNIQQAAGLAGSFTALNTRVIEKAVAQKWLGSNYSDRIWDNKDRLITNIERIIPQGVARGQNPRVIAREIRDAMGTSYKNAVRLARTEFNHIANDATHDSYKESGIVEKYQFLATLDHRTSEICQSLASEIFELGEKIEGVNWPPVHPNCRSTTIPYFPPDEIDAMFNDAATRIARDPETGKNYFAPADMTYKQWRESLTESQGEMFLARQKMDKYNQADKDQLAGYKRFISAAKKEHGAELIGKLFPDFPRSISEFQSMKYLGRFERDGEMIHIDWEAIKENRQKLI